MIGPFGNPRYAPRCTGRFAIDEHEVVQVKFLASHFEASGMPSNSLEACLLFSAIARVTRRD
jgi:hypothetical protein